MRDDLRDDTEMSLISDNQPPAIAQAAAAEAPAIAQTPVVARAPSQLPKPGETLYWPNFREKLLITLKSFPGVFTQFTTPLDGIDPQKTAIADVLGAIEKVFSLIMSYLDPTEVRRKVSVDDLKEMRYRFNEAGKLISIHVVEPYISFISGHYDGWFSEHTKPNIEKLKDLQKQVANLFRTIQDVACRDTVDNIIAAWEPKTYNYKQLTPVEKFFRLNPKLIEKFSGVSKEDKFYSLAFQALTEHDQSKSSVHSFFSTNTDTKKAFERIGINFKDYDLPLYSSYGDRIGRMQKVFEAKMSAQSVGCNASAAQGCVVS